MSEIDIRVSKVHRQLVFTLSSRSGSPPRVEGVTVFDLELERTCWMLLPSARAGKAETWEQRMSAAGLRVPQGVDPIEDLPPTDPRYRIAEHHMLDMVEQGRVELSSLVYGVVPPGFAQITPDESSAMALEAGHRYEITISGEEPGSLVFAAL
jgi:hypothetical protein